MRTITPLGAALRYARAGYPVIPVWQLDGTACACPAGSACKAPGKHPIQTAWQTRATTDAERVRSIFRKYPKAHVGILPPPGHCIVDLDPRNGGKETWVKLIGHTRTLDTPTQRSGGGGAHLVFKGEPPAALGPGIDIKKPGRGFVVAWPSGHVSGGKYEWKKSFGLRPAQLPESLRMASGSEGSAQAPQPLMDIPIDRTREALAYIDPDLDYEEWINFGQALKHAYGDDGEEVWTEWSQTGRKWKASDADRWAGFDHNRDRDLVTLKSLFRRARKSGYSAPRSTTAGADFEPTLLGRGNIRGMTGTDAAPIQWVFNPGIPRGKVTLLSGAGGSSKSFLALTLGAQFTIGQPFGPFQPEDGGKVVALVAEEDVLDTHRRIRAIAKAQQYTPEQCERIERDLHVVSVRGEDWRLHYRDEAGDLQESERVAYIIRELRMYRGRIKLLIFDPLVFFNGGNENDNMEMSRVMATLDRIAAETGVAVLVLHHVSKGGQVTSMSEATQAVIRGASSLVDNARSAMLLTRMPRTDAPMYGMSHADADRHIVIRHLKANYGPHMLDAVFAIGVGGALRYAPEIQKIHSTPAKANRAIDQQTTDERVLAAYAEDPEATQRDIAKKINKDQSTVKRAADRLIEAGLLRREMRVGRTDAFFATKKGERGLNKDAPQDDFADLLA